MSALQAAFFRPDWADVLVGRMPVEDALARAIAHIGWTVGVEDVLDAWFESDFALDRDVLAWLQEWSDRGVRIVLATNQEHRRARFLRARLGEAVPVSDMVYSAAIGYVKNQPGFFEVAATRVRTPVPLLTEIALRPDLGGEPGGDRIR